MWRPLPGLIEHWTWNLKWLARFFHIRLARVKNYEPLFISLVIVQPLVSNSVALIHVESSGGFFFHLTKCSRWSFFLIRLVTLLSIMAPNFNGCVTSVQVGIYISSAFAENFLSVLQGPTFFLFSHVISNTVFVTSSLVLPACVHNSLNIPVPLFLSLQTSCQLVLLYLHINNLVFPLQE